MAASPLQVELEREGRLLKLTLARPRANIVDAAMIEALQRALSTHRDDRELAAVLLLAEGPNFSFGASVEEHLPGECEKMLPGLHRLIITLIDYPVPVLVAVQGFCLGGGMEVAIAGDLLFAAENASFAQPEIQLGVFAPAASCLLPERIGYVHAADLLWSGRSIDAGEALGMGLVVNVSADPVAAALDYFDKQLAPRSSFALRHAVMAVKQDRSRRLQEKLATVEKQYLDGLMPGADPVEGLKAFMAKRTPVWRHK